MSNARQAVREPGVAGEPDERPGRDRPWLRWALIVVAAVLVHGPVLRRPGRTLSAAEQRLVKVAREALRRGDEGLDYGGFFLHAERAAGGPVEARWRQLGPALAERARPGGEEGVSALVLALFRQASLGHYRREEARLSGLLAATEAGGNCEAQTKLLVSAVRAARPRLPDHHELGVEVFQDHVQAVLVDRRRGTLWNLLTGERDARPRADVYRPAVLLAAYLRGLELDPPVAESRLLLARGPRPVALRRGWDFFTTSTLRLPASTSRFAASSPPERAELPPPAPPPAPGGTGDLTATWRDEFAGTSDLRLLFAMDRHEAPFALVGTTLVFRQKDDWQRHQSTRSTTERRAQLVGLAARRLEAELASGPIELPPDQLGQLTDDDFSARLGRLDRLGQLVSLAEQAIDRGRGGTAAAEIELRLPALSALDAAVLALTDDAARRPAAFWQRLGELAPERRRALLAFLVPRLQSSQVSPLALALGDPRQLALVAGDRTGGGGPARGPAAWTMDVELLAAPLGVVAPASSGGSIYSAPAPAAAPTGAADRQAAAPAALPVGAYLDAVLSGLFISALPAEIGPVLDRWSPEVSAALAARAGHEGASLELSMKVDSYVERPLQELDRPVPAHLLAVLGPNGKRARTTR